MLLFVFMVFHTSNSQNTSILVFSKTAGYKHKSIASGKQALNKMATENDWNITFSADASLFNPKNLSNFDVLVFLNTTGDILNDEQQNAMKSFLTNGKGFVGIHSAADTEADWEWYVNLLGATFGSHPKAQKATLHINKSHMHKAVEHLNDSEVFFDEWYNFLNPVAQHVNVLATLDENSYSGEQMGITHPITWYHHYDGARVFYTGLGHTTESYADERLLKQLEAGIKWASGMEQATTLSDKWTSLLAGKPNNNWDIFIGVPHKTIKDLPNIDPNSNGIKGEPLGLNNDPKKVFNFIADKNGKHTVHITGEIYGALTTKQEYENYHLKLKVKWGKKKWEPRLENLRDSGLLYHCVGPYRKFWNVWMRSQELQIQEGDMGDYYALGGAAADIPAKKAEENGKTMMFYDQNGEFYTGNTKIAVDNEKDNGKWNSIELITFNGTSIHIVNGQVMMTLYNSRQKHEEGFVPLTRGKIQIQSEGAEVFYKDIEIKSIYKIPSEYQYYLKD